MSPLLTTSELRTLRHFTDPDELLRLCRDAARYAVRAPFTPDDRAECVAELYGYVIETVAADADEHATRHGRPSDVLAYIGRVLAADRARQVAAMPRPGDRRFTFTALANRAADWRRRADVERGRSALLEGAEDARRAPAPDAVDADEHGRRLAALSVDAARRAARQACESLGLDAGTDAAPSGAACVFYVWTRDTDPETAASELGIGHAAMRQRISRAGAAIRAAVSMPELLASLACGERVTFHAARTAPNAGRRVIAYIDAVLAASPLTETDSSNLLRETDLPKSKRGPGYIFSLTDATREAGTPHVKLTPPDREGTANGAAPVRPLTAAEARQLCVLRKQRPAPVAASKRRDAAHAADGCETDEHRDSRARARLGAALGSVKDTHAGTGAKRARIGRTSGKAPERYAPRAVRLGNN